MSATGGARGRRAAIALAILAVAAAPGEEPTARRHPRPSEGEIDGFRAIAVWPAFPDAPGVAGDPAGFTLWLEDEAGRVEPIPAGEWFLPTEGWYSSFLEGPGWISPVCMDGPCRRRPFEGSGTAGLAGVVPAAVVRVVRDTLEVGDAELHLLHLESHIREGGGHNGPELFRRLELGADDRELQMPAGPLVAGLWDRAAREYRALERLDVSSREVTEWLPVPPAIGRSALWVEIDHPPPPDDPTRTHDLALRWVDAAGASHAPSAWIDARRKVYGFWFDLPDGPGKLEGSASQLGLRTEERRLRSGRVERIESRLFPLPRLAIALDLPPELAGEKVALALRSSPGGVELERTLPPGVVDAVFDAVPAEQVRVKARIAEWELERTIDLSDGRDGELVVSASWLPIHGTVFYGRAPHPAEVSIVVREPDEKQTVRTDEEGRYEALLIEPRVYFFKAQLDGRALPFLLPVEIAGAGRYDLELPANDFGFRVRDARTGGPIEGAALSVGNRAGDGSFATSNRVVTDEHGRARSQPLRPGTLTYLARAEGYQPSAPGETEVPEADDELVREIEIELEPEGPTASVRFVLANGAPAAGAELYAVRPDPGGWQGTADGDGRVDVPERFLGGPLYVRHPSAGGAVRVVRSAGEQWTLPGPRSAPLTIRAFDAAGSPSAWSLVVVYLDGMRLEQRGLNWLSGGTPVTTADGVWSWPGAPAGPVGLLVVRNEEGAMSLAESGALDGERNVVPDPSAPVVEVRSFP